MSDLEFDQEVLDHQFIEQLFFNVFGAKQLKNICKESGIDYIGG